MTGQPPPERLLADAAQALADSNPAKALAILSATDDRLRSSIQYYQLCGLAHARQGNAIEARRCFIAGLDIAPDHPGLLSMLARISIEKHLPAEAAEWLARLVRLQPDDAGLQDALARMLLAAGRPEAALAPAERAVALSPASLALHLQLGACLRQLNRIDAARAAFEAALRLAPDSVPALVGLSDIALESEDVGTAERHVARALELAPEDGAALGTLGLLRAQQGRRAEAIASCLDALKRRPDDHLAHNNCGLMLLRAGRLPEAWPLLEWRWRNPVMQYSKVYRRWPKWTGATAPGQKILLWPEQGVGDHLVYAALLPELVQRGADLVMACDERLVPLFARSYPNVQVLGGNPPKALDTLGITHQLPMGDLLPLLRPQSSDPPPPAGYLRPDEARVNMLRARYASLRARRVVGISWRSGNPRIGGVKSLSLEDFLPVLQCPDTAFVNLQYGNSQPDIAAFAARHGIDIHTDADIDPLHDLDGQAAQVAALDEVVSVSTAVVHIACAVGTMARVILPFERGLLWYWGEEGDTSPWRAGARLYRPRFSGDRTSAIARCAADMIGLAR